MRPLTLTLLGLLGVLGSTELARAKFVRHALKKDNKGINTGDIKACYERVVARYASKKKRKQHSQASPMIYGELKLALPDSAEDGALAPVTERGTLLSLNAAGDPQMLGNTYNTVVGMGTPTQLFNLTVDTGSTLTLAVLASCKESDCPGVEKKNTYDPSKSTSSEQLHTHHGPYGDGEMDLMLYTDVVSLDKIRFKSTVGGAYKTFEMDGKLAHDGLLGLGREPNGQPVPMLDSLAKTNSVFDQIIALDLGPNPSLEIGGYDFERYANLATFKMMGDDGWSLGQSSITALGADGAVARELLLDTGSSVSVLPVADLDAIINRPGLRVQKDESEPTVYSMPCDTKLNVQLILPDGTKVPVPDEDILIESNDPMMPGCLCLLVGTSRPFLPAVVGTAFLKRIYMVLRMTHKGDWIGLAPLQVELPART